MYIVISNKTNRVIKQGIEEFKGLSNQVTQIEVENVPKVAKGQYLTYENGAFVTNNIVYTEEQKAKMYENLVDKLIRQKYSLSNELAILRQRDTKVEEFAAYNTYVEDCKAKAKAEIYN